MSRHYRSHRHCCCCCCCPFSSSIDNGLSFSGRSSSSSYVHQPKCGPTMTPWSPFFSVVLSEERGERGKGASGRVSDKGFAHASTRIAVSCPYSAWRSDQYFWGTALGSRNRIRHYQTLAAAADGGGAPTAIPQLPRKQRNNQCTIVK